jgi:hypothetical protein
MAYIGIQNYLTQDLTPNEKKSYIEYIQGNTNYTDWITKVNIRRDQILALELHCPKQCNAWIGIYENGICKCNVKGHECSSFVLKKLLHS